jgi:hypothetical protein
MGPGCQQVGPTGGRPNPGFVRTHLTVGRAQLFQTTSSHCGLPIPVISCSCSLNRAREGGVFHSHFNSPTHSLYGHRSRRRLQHHQGRLLPDGSGGHSTHMAGKPQERLHRLLGRSEGCLHRQLSMGDYLSRYSSRSISMQT